MTEFDGIREQQGIGGVVHGAESALVVKGNAYVEYVTCPKIPRLGCVVLVVDEDFASNWPSCVVL